MLRIILLFVVFCRFIVSEDSENEGPIVTTKQGQIKGLELENVVNQDKFYAFMSIPYAAPPVGDRRFMPPVEPESWEGVRESSEDKFEGCLTSNFWFKTVDGEEDCLYLHVFTPKKPEELQDDLKAVMFWIHGGAFHAGTGSPFIYGPDFLLLQDVVVVNIHYRLNVFGFLCTNDSEASGNAGLKDQVMALKWVQNNIKSFGGDPNRVTIFGESAGGTSVHYLMLSPTSKGLFHRAIAQSGTALNFWALSLSPEKTAIKLGEVFDCGTSNLNEIIKCLKNLDAEELALYQYNGASLDDDVINLLPFFPCVERQGIENSFITEQPKDVVVQGKFHNVPFITGTVAYETLAIITLFTSKHVPDGLKKTLLKEYNQKPEIMLPFHWKINDPARRRKAGKRIKRFYFQKQPVSNLTLRNMINLTSDTLFLIGTHNAVTYHSKLAKSPVYQYYFVGDTEYAFTKATLGIKNFTGPGHVDDIGHLFYIYNAPQKLDRESIGFQTMTKVTKLWTNFAKYGNPTPNSDMGFIWTPSKPDKKSYLEINTEFSIKEFAEKERMRFWEKLRMEENIDML